jgi:hypothetical protein
VKQLYSFPLPLQCCIFPTASYHCVANE